MKTKVARVPVIMQMEAIECGAACLAMVAAYYKKWIPLEQVRVDCGVSRDGSNLKNIAAAARSYGLDARGYSTDLEGLMRNAHFPCILYWNNEHFVVLCGIRAHKAIINDPSRGNIKIDIEELKSSYSGVFLQIGSDEGFTPSGSRKSVLTFVKNRLKNSKIAIGFAVFVSVVSYAFGIVNPVMSKFFYDNFLTGRSDALFIPFIILLSVLAFLQIAFEWLETVYSHRIDGRMAIDGNASYVWKALRLPMEFYSQRMTGDIMGRQETNAAIAGTLVSTVSPLILHTFMMVFYLAFMISVSPAFTLLGILSVCLNVLAGQVVASKRINLMRVQMMDEGKLYSQTVTGINMAETIKASGAEEGFFAKWSGYQASVNEHNIRLSDLNIRYGIIPQLLSQILGYVVLFFGVRLIIDGHFTLGLVTAFQQFLVLFMDPAQSIIDAGQTIMQMRTQMERVEDVLEYPSDPLVQDEKIRDDIEYSKLSGALDIQGMTFGYCKLADPVIRDFSLNIAPGECVAIVGMSGSGKSTVSRLITGLYTPWEGSILYDGREIVDIPRSVFTGSVAMVDQDIVLFEDTIRNNISMWDDTIEDFEVILAARDAGLHDDISMRSGTYQSMIQENGRNLSGGQRQRLEIARVLAQDPSVIILDEATSALDAVTEYEVMSAIRNRGITCIVIAHRLSTIRDCDRIVVMEEGRIAQIGTHDELLNSGGIYSKLLASE